LEQALEALVMTQREAQIGEADYAIAALRAALAQQAEPVRGPMVVMNLNQLDAILSDLKRHAEVERLRAQQAEPVREWQGLTDEEIKSLLPGAVRVPPGWRDTVTAIEAALKEKNT
jgi:hypothetical protein